MDDVRHAFVRRVHPRAVPAGRCAPTDSSTPAQCATAPAAAATDGHSSRPPMMGRSGGRSVGRSRRVASHLCPCTGPSPRTKTTAAGTRQLSRRVGHIAITSSVAPPRGDLVRTEDRPSFQRATPRACDSLGDRTNVGCAEKYNVHVCVVPTLRTSMARVIIKTALRMSPKTCHSVQ